MISSSHDRQAEKSQTSLPLRTSAPTHQETKQPKAQVSPHLTDKVSQGGVNEGAAQKGKRKYIYIYVYARMNIYIYVYARTET